MSWHAVVNVLGFVAFALNVWGNWLLTRKSESGWTVRIVSILCWGAYGIGAASWPNVVNAVTFLGINIYGLRRWRNERLRATPPHAPAYSGMPAPKHCAACGSNPSVMACGHAPA